ncbi:phospholipase A2 inhibitor and Ly6/PLAUR domain-containing protein-like [Python bivittatus]|uniref:Phospholipase A2 inhibitor and Ly6/PLAUR domain-containing protein-like n=1 Tax=Python bivittatus TaxID=176946 RepID=A0A9F2R8X3_PYTBI|nr:phospholipase A2 inhibitor and Ly6/PLAUR domain-containing protein-like [Python bivittatus]
MQMSSIIYFFFSILIPAGVCLKCEYCSSSSGFCTGAAHICRPFENTCLTLTTETTIGNEVWLATYKGCTKIKHCVPSPMSFTLPSRRKRSAAKCCRKDLCNSGTVTLPRLGIRPNGLKCPGCISQDLTCKPTELIHCNGWEDYCVYYDLTVEQDGRFYTHAERGCGTKNACLNEARVFGVPGLYKEIIKKPECTPAPKIIGKWP